VLTIIKVEKGYWVVLLCELRRCERYTLKHIAFSTNVWVCKGLLGLCALFVLWGGLAGCGELAVRACFVDADCEGNGEAIYCYQQKCSTQQCTGGERRDCYDGKEGTADIGKCRKGLQLCGSDGLWSACFGQVIPRVEVCDREDNNCDGQVDEGVDCSCQKGERQRCFNGPEGASGQGECKAGVQFCENDFKWGRCLEQSLPAQEICDERDNDCDGQIDNGLTCDCAPGSSRACYTGPEGTLRLNDSDPRRCVAGLQYCGADNKWGECVGQILPARREACNGVDDDCNGLVDDNIPEVERLCVAEEAIGACRNGVFVCNAGRLFCEPGQPTGKEVCGNGIDDNCDGEIDESSACTCKPGETRDCFSGDGCVEKDGKWSCTGTCQSGTQFCQSNQTWGACLGSVSPTAETCDNKDNDCDGQVDENLTRTCYEGGNPTLGKGECKGGTQVCQAGKWGACNGQVLPVAEACDGKDNDCDGLIDNGCKCLKGETRDCYGGPAGTEFYAPCKKGTQTCLSDGSWGACAGAVTPSPEVCDGKDDDCDGFIDNQSGKPEMLVQSCYTGAAGTKEVGDCQGGLRTCRAGVWGACLGQKTPTSETCNGIDDDCDGQIDNQKGLSAKIVQSCYSGSSITAGTGSCKAGTQTCSNGAWSVCTGAVTPIAEQCNNKDDDCNGLIDDGLSQACYSGPAGTLGNGRCQAGVQSCQAGQWGACIGEVTPSLSEACDGQDDNCDGFTDEGCVCKKGNVQKCYSGPAGTQQHSPCQQGTQTCLGNGSWGACTGEVQPTTEVCDGVDNDCDGLVDDGIERSCYTGPNGTVGRGECKRGRQVCVNGSWGACTGESKPLAEVCDGKDNDCDGWIDNQFNQKVRLLRDCYSAAAVTRKIGECKDGVQYCQGGAWSACFGDVTPVTELCNGKDDDCDGQVDEGLTQACSSTCGTGSRACVGGSWSNNCVIPTQQERCNQRDDDCDGLVDEGCQCGQCQFDVDCTSGAKVGKCVQGHCLHTCNTLSCLPAFTCASSGNLKDLCTPPQLGTTGNFVWSCANYLAYGQSCTNSSAGALGCGGQDATNETGGYCLSRTCQVHCRKDGDCLGSITKCVNNMCR